MEKKRISRRNLLKMGSFLTGGALFKFGYLDSRNIEVVRVTVPVKDLPSLFEGYKIGVLSDTHFPQGASAKVINQAITVLKAQEPDIIVVPGDFVHQKQPGIDLNLTPVFGALGAPHGVWGVMGNHDYWYGDKEVERMIKAETPIRLLRNSAVRLEREKQEIAIGGVDDLWEGSAEVAKAFEGIPESMPRILLSHHPDVAETYKGERVRVDLQISGHTHGGQVVLPGIIDPARKVSRYGSKFNRGLVDGAAHRVFISKGLSSAGRYRFFAPPDVAVITLVRG